MRNNKFFAIVDAETGEILYDTNAWNGTLSHMLDLLEKSGWADKFTHHIYKYVSGEYEWSDDMTIANHGTVYVEEVA